MQSDTRLVLGTQLLFETRFLLEEVRYATIVTFRILLSAGSDKISNYVLCVNSQVLHALISCKDWFLISVFLCILLYQWRHKAHRCPYSSVLAADGSGNHCIHAHSDAELDEWRERYKWRQSRKVAAKQQHLYSYMATLRDEYSTDETDSTVSRRLQLSTLHRLSLLCVSSLNTTNPISSPFTYSVCSLYWQLQIS